MSVLLVPDKQILSSEADLQSIRAILENSQVDPIVILEAINKLGILSLQAITNRALHDTNQIVIEDNRAYITSEASVEQVAGRVFESFITEIMKSYYDIGLKLVKWSTNLDADVIKLAYGYKSLETFYADLFILSKGAKFTRSWFTHKFSTSSKDDIEFYLPPKIIKGKIIPPPVIGGFQVKAIQKNEKDEIIIPLRLNHYSHVLTLLENKDGEHSYKRCMDIIDNMVVKKEMHWLEGKVLKKKIGHPKMFDIPQWAIQGLYERVLKLERKVGINIDKNIDKIGKIRSVAFSLGLDNHIVSFNKESQGARTIVKLPKNIRRSAQLTR